MHDGVQATQNSRSIVCRSRYNLEVVSELVFQIMCSRSFGKFSPDLCDCGKLFWADSPRAVISYTPGHHEYLDLTTGGR